LREGPGTPRVDLVAPITAAVCAAYVLSLVRDLPRRIKISVAGYAAAFIAIGIGAGYARMGEGFDPIGLGGICLFGAFIIVTGGHAIRAANIEMFSIPQEVLAKYNQHPSRYQIAGLALGLGVYIPLGLMRGYF
jgi:hypothetical protein